MIYELIICTAIIGGNCRWQITEHPSLPACEAAVAAILRADREARRLPPAILYCRPKASAS